MSQLGLKDLDVGREVNSFLYKDDGKNNNNADSTASNDSDNGRRSIEIEIYRYQSLECTINGFIYYHLINGRYRQYLLQQPSPLKTRVDLLQ